MFLQTLICSVCLSKSISCWLAINQDSYLRSKEMMKLAKEITTANSLVNDSESEDEAVLFVIVTPVMLDQDLNQKYNR